MYKFLDNTSQKRFYLPSACGEDLLIILFLAVLFDILTYSAMKESCFEKYRYIVMPLKLCSVVTPLGDIHGQLMMESLFGSAGVMFGRCF